MFEFEYDVMKQTDQGRAADETRTEAIWASAQEVRGLNSVCERVGWYGKLEWVMIWECQRIGLKFDA